MTTNPTASQPAEASFPRQLLSSVTLASGAGQVVDFALPLFAGAVLGLTAAQTGALLAAGLATSFLLRPLGGVAADRYDRTTIAAASALVLGAGYALVASAGTFHVVLAGVLVSRAGGAFLWVALRATAGARHQVDPGAFARLMSAEELGSWVVLAPAIALLAVAGYPLTFAAAAGCALLAGGLLASSRGRASARGSGDVDAPRAVPAAGDGRVVVRELATRLRPLLIVVMVIGTAEGAVGLLLVLHLQRELGLGPLAIAWVSLPGGIALAVAPPHMHRLTVRFGRTPVLVAAAIAGAAFAGGLALARDPVTIAVLWVLSALALAAILPIEQAALTEAAGTARIGRALGLYEATTLLAAALGSLAAGILYDAVPWPAACVTFAAVILAGGLLLPRTICRLTAASAAD
ncbi:MFS transporter [Clavibacter sepedonicus]|uniref:Probable major facilitator superfamily transporter n=1 Tax=Clavibacter sepedonicus TaxID=31964 RepID=B0RJ69_CLASE|nr:MULTISPECIES: MFS transporter [Clavibacter]MBD5382559.1 MFS transporter [Clavibacter sp.]OQJ45212.1 MFS transporter [Clavibacter sepedonicus]OQJ50847.1 MFS transporter [Clavibacter sepedonicus]UUK67356.1 MFS transporter [Clavibacter sepedonicus]CAQ03259.1 probable major facilitator superfamily transporter [Clavibacter sepedonicus]